MASRAEDWRRRIERGLARQESDSLPGQRLLERVVGAPSAEFLAWLERPLAPAAVLVGLIERRDGPRVLLTERAAHLANHPGQISFPGGSLAAAETVEQAALREATEEIGLMAGHASVLGRLRPQMTGSGFTVAPVVAIIDDRFEPVPDPAEVAAVFELPLANIRAAGARRRVSHRRHGTEFLSEEFAWQGYRIWGATAHILIDMLEVIDG